MERLEELNTSSIAFIIAIDRQGECAFWNVTICCIKVQYYICHIGSLTEFCWIKICNSALGHMSRMRWIATEDVLKWD